MTLSVDPWRRRVKTLSVDLWRQTLEKDMEEGRRTIPDLRRLALERRCLLTLAIAATCILVARNELDGPIDVKRFQSDGKRYQRIKIGERPASDVEIAFALDAAADWLN